MFFDYIHKKNKAHSIRNFLKLLLGFAEEQPETANLKA